MSFKDIVGLEPVVKLLKGQLTKDRLANTYLLAGPDGIGKRTLAMEFSKALECPQMKAGEACDACDVCKAVAQGTFPDFKLVAPESDTGLMKIDQVRTLTNWLSLTSYQGRWKVALIEGADAMTEEAAHACLKLLEEPPDKSILILIAAAPHRLPATLVSRCHLVRCAPQGIERVAVYLRQQEKLDEPLAQALAALAGGRLGAALQFHREEGVAAKNKQLDGLLAAWRQRVLEIPLGSTSRAEVVEALDWWVAWWRDLLLIKLHAEPGWLIHQDRWEDLKRTEPSLTLDQIMERIEFAYVAQEAVQRNASSKIALGALLAN